MTKTVCFARTARVRRVTVDPYARLLEVTNLYDRFGNDIDDPGLAEACVVALPDGGWVSATTDDIPVYTVH